MLERIKIIALVVVPLLFIMMSLMMGSTGNLTLTKLFEEIRVVVSDWLGGVNDVTDASLQTILWQVRLPRIVLTFMVGASLATSGGVLQSIFRNPLVDPFSLGISSGAAFGAALSMLIPVLSISVSAFLFGVVAVGITYLVSYSGVRTSLVTMVLSGMIISGVFTAFLTVLQYLSDPYKLQAIVQWTMGSLHTASWDKVRVATIPIMIGLVLIYLSRWRLNLLALGDQEALAVGINPKGTKLLLIAVTTMITASSVAAVGMISLFGLIVPHVSRIIFGPNNEIGVLANISIGGTFLLLIDNLSRTLLPYEVPVGVFTMVLGAPLFIYLMRKNVVNWNG